MFDSEGNLWVGDNFTIGWQGQDKLWQGNATKFAPNGKPLSPITTGFAGGGMQGGTFGAAIDAKDNAWLTSYGGKSITVFDKNGKPLTPPEGITFDGRLGLMQGVIVTPSGNVWVLGLSKGQLVHFPNDDLSTRDRSFARGGTEASSLALPLFRPRLRNDLLSSYSGDAGHPPVGGTFQFQIFIQAPSPEIWSETIFGGEGVAGAVSGVACFGLPP